MARTHALESRLQAWRRSDRRREGASLAAASGPKNQGFAIADLAGSITCFQWTERAARTLAAATHGKGWEGQGLELIAVDLVPSIDTKKAAPRTKRGALVTAA